MADKTLSLITTYDTVHNELRIIYDEFGIEYWNANDINKFVPDKRLDTFMKTQDTKEFIEKLAQTISPPHGVTITRKGRGASTYMYRLLALRFAAWLSKDFELHIYKTYDEQRQLSDEWSKERIITKYEFHLLTDTIKDYIAINHPKEKQGFVYGAELGMINRLIFGIPKSTTTKNLRDTATQAQLHEISELQHHNKTLIMLGFPRDEREILLNKLLNQFRTKQISTPNI